MTGFRKAFTMRSMGSKRKEGNAENENTFGLSLSKRGTVASFGHWSLKFFVHEIRREDLFKYRWLYPTRSDSKKFPGSVDANAAGSRYTL